ncbi:hypothetical protein Rsub_12678 [Raphidocelis subcapitata]|uniref:Uncharacterized protein n=1 Tax=Raphidocelis subcapitata TaxID=307507 RepID=A0A2V0PLE7_9CHLO|nr:hypothetical protein Rsub_12678 [Raphidocelis subcapitata]|eukprot:GBF99882.1 hypothetical protein Rsub_12678 [Raphidocelis subcapitata]
MAALLSSTRFNMKNAQQQPARRAAGSRRVAAPARRPVVVRAALNTETKSPVAQFADSIGLPTEEGVFGFRPFAEVWCGRLAMMGFVTSIVEEAVTGRGTLRQIGLEPSPGLFTGLSIVLGVALVAGTASTAAKLAQRKMTAKDVARYKNFLGLNNANDFVVAAREMKSKGDFTKPGDSASAIAAAKAAGTPVDAFLSTNEAAEAADAAAAMKAAAAPGSAAGEAAEAAAAAAGLKAGAAAAGPSVSLAAREDLLEEKLFSGSYESKYAREVEVTNGRAAMVGFLAAVMVEAATGHGIILQLIDFFKFTGFLGPASGF